VQISIPEVLHGYSVCFYDRKRRLVHGQQLGEVEGLVFIVMLPPELIVKLIDDLIDELLGPFPQRVRGRVSLGY